MIIFFLRGRWGISEKQLVFNSNETMTVFHARLCVKTCSQFPTLDPTTNSYLSILKSNWFRFWSVSEKKIVSPWTLYPTCDVENTNWHYNHLWPNITQWNLSSSAQILYSSASADTFFFLRMERLFFMAEPFLDFLDLLMDLFLAILFVSWIKRK